MTCGTAEPWLLAARSPEALPGEVRQHLARCPECVALVGRLVRLHEATVRLTPAAAPAARARLDAALSLASQVAPEAEAGRPAARWGARLGAVAAVALLLAGGWWAGRATAPAPAVPAPRPAERRPAEPTPPAPELPAVAPSPSPPPGLVAKVASHCVSVAAGPSASQLDVLNGLAADVRAEALARAAAGDLEPLPRLVGLHDRVLKLGVAKQLARLPEPDRAALAARLSAALGGSADEVAAASGALAPVAAEMLSPLAASCREVGAALRTAAPLVVSPAWPAPATPLESLVAHALRTADADTPLARADESTHLAAALAHAVTVLSVAGRPDDAARVGGALDLVLDAGVAANLDRVEAADPAGKLRKEVAAVRERAGRATDVLERNLARAPPAARVGLERALAASAPGRGKATGKPAGKGNGPPWKKDDHPGKGPPGWSKKS
ncbi:unnamed protein product [Gemmataceae bacterium]|nr:unnamed protein product [Gemmataceae bacterium]VTU02243.1 unnamed protein product [Gemmataceae bacterium]